MDVDGDGSSDLDASRIYYFGISFGGIFGTVLTPIEPRVQAAVLNVAGGSVIEQTRLSPVARGPALGAPLAARILSLLNFPGITELGGVPVSRPYFNENIPLRNQPPVINTITGAMEIQTWIDNQEWVTMSGDPLAYARHIRQEPLDGIPAKPVIFQFAKGDQSVPNPTTTALVRAGALADRATYYRHDLAFAANRALPKNPHAFAVNFTTPAAIEIAVAALTQITTFFATEGLAVIDPDGPEQANGIGRLFEVPIVAPLPEDLNYIP